MSEKPFAKFMQVPDGKNKFTVKEFFLNPSISTSWLKRELIFLNPTSLDFEKSYAVISFKFSSALSGEKN
jgi:hypothetical protein